MAICAVLLGIASAETSATTVPGRFGMFGLGALVGLVLGIRVGLSWPNAGAIFRGYMVACAVAFAALDVATVIGWVS